MRIAAVILAAGAATRMGKIKQLLTYRGRTLVEHAIAQAQGAGFSPVVAVVGAEAEAVREAVERTGASAAFNPDWPLGMGSSITTGVAAVLEMAPEADAVAVLLADQPYITDVHLLGMCREFEMGGGPILAARYAETFGVPAIFSKDVIPVLQALSQGAGARQILRQSGAGVVGYALPEASMDVDTPEDFANLGED